MINSRSCGAIRRTKTLAARPRALGKFVPDLSFKLKDANAKEIKLEEVVEHAQQAAVLVLVY